MKNIRCHNKSDRLASRARALLSRKVSGEAKISRKGGLFSRNLLLAAGTALIAVLPLTVGAETTLPNIEGAQSVPSIVDAAESSISEGGTILNVVDVTMGEEGSRIVAGGSHAALISLGGNNGSDAGGKTLLPSQYYGNITLNVTNSTLFGTTNGNILEGLYAKTMSTHDGSEGAVVPVTTVNVSGGIIDVRNTGATPGYLNAILAEAQVSAADSTAGKLAGNVVVGITDGAKIKTSSTASAAPLNTGGAIHASGYNSTVTTEFGTSIEVNGAGLTGIIASASQNAVVNNAAMITGIGSNTTGISSTAAVVTITNSSTVSAARGIVATGRTSASVINSGLVETTSTAINVHSNGTAMVDNSGAIFTNGPAASGLAIISGGGSAATVINRQFGTISSGGFGIYSIASLGTRDSSIISNEILAPSIYSGAEGVTVINDADITSGKAAISARTTGGLIDSALAAGDVTVNVGGDSVIINTGNLKTTLSTSGTAEPTPHGISAIVRGVEIDATGGVTGNVSSNVTGNAIVGHTKGTIETSAEGAHGIYALVEGTVNRGSGNVTGTVADNVSGNVLIGYAADGSVAPITGTITAAGNRLPASTPEIPARAA